MRRPFASGRKGVVVALPAEERRVLVQLLGQLDALLDDGSGSIERDPLAEAVGFDLPWPGEEPAAPESSEPPDPALERLFPAATRDDDAAADEFRRLTEGGLRARKRSGARVAVAALERPDPVVLGPEEAAALLKALTDLRLVLADRIGLKTDADADALHRALTKADDADEPWVGAAALYEALTWWQESLVGAVTSR